MTLDGPHAPPPAFAGAAADRRQTVTAAAICAAAAVLALILLPMAPWPVPALPGFYLINQAALIVAYGLSAWVLFAQSRRGASLPLLIIAGGTLYTAAIVLLQLLSVPGAIAAGRILGHGSETTIWLWTFWHIGPPLCALGFALARRRGENSLKAPLAGMFVAVTGGVFLAALAAIVATLALPYLPQQVTGDDYTAMTRSGVGPGVELLTLVALGAIWASTRPGRSVLEIWLLASLALLVIDNLLTMAGASRGSVGWIAGRVLALISAFSILWAYLHEVDALRLRAEATARELAQTGAALRQAQKMEAVGRLTGGIAHDFNNMLTVITSGFEMIRRRPEDCERVRRMADSGLEAAQRGARLTAQLLTFARRQVLRPETVNPNALLLGFEPLMRRATGEAIELTVTLDPALHPTLVDRGEFEAAVLNLVVNARDAVPPQGGRITITSRNARRESGSAARGLEMRASAGDHAVVSVVDNGHGMDEATLAQVFEPFFTTKEFGKGSGLGLSQVYGFARAAGGSVEIASTPGRGTTVELWLPLAAPAPLLPVADPPSQRELAPVAVPAPAGRRMAASETVLAVEDEPALLEAVVENLTELGYRVLPARDAAEALAGLRAEPDVDILFTDIVMPGGMNGVELAAEALRLRPGLRVLLTSGYSNEALAGQHRVPSNVSLLRKPYRRTELVERLEVTRAAVS